MEEELKILEEALQSHCRTTSLVEYEMEGNFDNGVRYDIKGEAVLVSEGKVFTIFSLHPVGPVARADSEDEAWIRFYRSCYDFFEEEYA